VSLVSAGERQKGNYPAGKAQAQPESSPLKKGRNAPGERRRCEKLPTRPSL